MAVPVAERVADQFQRIANDAVRVVFGTRGPRELMIDPAFTVNSRQDFAHALFAGAAVGGVDVVVQNVQSPGSSPGSVQPLRSVQVVGFPETN